VPGNHRGILREFSAHISQLLAAGHIGSEAVVEYRAAESFAATSRYDTPRIRSIPIRTWVADSNQPLKALRANLHASCSTAKCSTRHPSITRTVRGSVNAHSVHGMSARLQSAALCPGAQARSRTTASPSGRKPTSVR
jgi:hypothetical protein